MPSNQSIAPGPSAPPPGPQSSFPQKRKRFPRAAIACNMCRIRKSRCNQDTPACSHCLRYGIECTYLAKKQDRRTRHSQNSISSANPISRSPAISLSASAGEHVPVNAAGFGRSILPRTESQQSRELDGSALQERSSVEDEVVIGTSKASGLSTAHSLPRTQETEREAPSNSNNAGLQSVNPIPLDSNVSTRRPAGEASITPNTTSSVLPASTPNGRMSDQRLRAEIGSGDRVDEINNHTNGAEFFGPSGTLPFLARLLAHSRVSAQHDAVPTTEGRPARDRGSSNPGELSLVNFLHSEDLPIPTRQHTPAQYHTTERTFASGTVQSTEPLVSRRLPLSAGRLPSDQNHNQSQNSSSLPSAHVQRDTSETPPTNRLIAANSDLSRTPIWTFNTRADQLELEKKCINLFFANLHYIHPILQKSSFIAQCASEVWPETQKKELKTSRPAHRSRFLALYNAVCAVGAITADEEIIRGWVMPRSSEEPSSATAPRAASKMSKAKATYPPLKLAGVFFEQAKSNLGDVFEISSLESTQALFLMSVFCQNALKPHSCYMYSGMAARTALAIGISNVKVGASLVDRTAASNLWWCIYAHEMEMCCSSGRDTLLKPPGYYSVPLTPADQLSSDPERHIVGAMVSFSQILQVASDELYHPLREKSLLEMSQTAIELDNTLQQWKRNLPPLLNIDKSSLRDPEWLSKQKVVLKLRFWNARIILHRQFLVASGKTRDVETFSSHISFCLDASRETINLLYNTYLNRHYFRTWWYNTTYVLYATMIILYLILLSFDKGNASALVEDVEKSLEVLGSMDEVHVAHRCAQLISEVLEIAKEQISTRKAQVDASQTVTFSHPNTNLAATHDQQADAAPTAFEGSFGGGMLSNLVDFNLLGDFAGFTDLNYFFTGADKMPVEADSMRLGVYNDENNPSVDGQQYFRGGQFLQGGQEGVL